jgi:enoyl-CoA hydratase
VSDPVTYDLDGAIATVTLDDGKANAFSVPTLRALHEALDQAERDGAIVVLRGRPGTLSGGFDLKTFAAGGDGVFEMLGLGAQLVERLLGFPRPVVAACPGHAMAAGAFVLLASDVRIGVRGDFRIGLNEVRIGLTVPHFVVALAQYRLARPASDRALLTAAIFDPASAREAGFLDQVVEAGALDETALAVANDLAGLVADAHTNTKLRARGALIETVRTSWAEEERSLRELAGVA